MKLVVITGNKGKAAEIEAITGLPVEARNLEIEEIQTLSVEEAARHKAKAAFAIVKQPVVVDDTGMYINALNGLPGALVAWFLKTVGPEGILKMVGSSTNRSARVTTCIGYADEQGVKTFLGEVKGMLPDAPRGSGGFGYDPIFIPEGFSKTFGEMTPEEKNQISMRKIALEKLRAYLTSSGAESLHIAS